MRRLHRLGLGILLSLGGLVSCGGSGGAADGGQSTRLSWYSTCGDPVCAGYRGPFPGVPLCSAQKEGDVCTTSNAQCDPQSACNTRLRCTDKDPKQQAGGCPISRATFKQDIHYLSDAQRAQLHREIQALKLATYRYKEAGPNAALRLGFLIDDVPRGAGSALATLAVDAERDQVDLYGYTSMLVATVQVQAEQIEALRAEIRALREAVAQRGRAAH